MSHMSRMSLRFVPFVSFCALFGLRLDFVWPFSVAQVLGRVNHSFACLTAYLSLRSMQRALRGHQGGEKSFRKNIKISNVFFMILNDFMRIHRI